jgi:RsiW-degrading membrane proteinase PrsW (M82 family)
VSEAGDFGRDFLVSLVPGSVWLVAFLRKDRYEPEPRGLILRAFLYGVLAVPAALVLERQLDRVLGGAFGMEALPRWAHLLLLVAPIEELLKFAVVRLRFYPDREFNEPVDGIVYATTVAIGFSTLENALYMHWAGRGTLVFRALASTLLHLGCSGLVGYALGRLKFSKQPVSVARTLGFVIALHAGFDLLVTFGPGHFGAAGAGVVLGLLTAILWWLWTTLDLEIEESLARSPFRPRRSKMKAPREGADEGDRP